MFVFDLVSLYFLLLSELYITYRLYKFGTTKSISFQTRELLLISNVFFSEYYFLQKNLNPQMIATNILILVLITNMILFKLFEKKVIFIHYNQNLITGNWNKCHDFIKFIVINTLIYLTIKFVVSRSSSDNQLLQYFGFIISIIMLIPSILLVHYEKHSSSFNSSYIIILLFYNYFSLANK